MKRLKKRKTYFDKPLVISLGIILLILVLPITVLLTQLRQTFHQQAVSGTIPQFSHVFVIVEENHDYSQIIGSNAAPYMNQLASQYGSAANFFAEAHPSLPNYIALTSGSTQGITSDCNTCFVNTTSIFQELEQSGKTWKSYHEDMPSNCYANDVAAYVMHHNPAVYYTPIKTSCAGNDVPYTQFASDLGGGKVGNLTFIIPNNNNEMHDGTIQQADTWLQQNLPAILNSPSYKQNGLIVITWDEDSDSGGTNQIATILISPLVKKGFTSSVRYDHYSLLRTLSDGLGVQPLGSAATAQPMADFFAQSVNPSPTSLPAPSNISPTFGCVGGVNCVPTSLPTTIPIATSLPTTSPSSTLSIVPSISVSTSPSIPVPSISGGGNNGGNGSLQGIMNQLLNLINQLLNLIKSLFSGGSGGGWGNGGGGHNGGEHDGD